MSPQDSQNCFCDPVKAEPFGVREADGRTYYNRCNRPVAIVGTDAIDPRLLTTLHQLPGHRITASHGVVSGIASDATLTAATKGRAALGAALPDLVAQALSLGGNAIVGIQASTYGARGGVTAALGGDAVGVLLIGTAVTVEPVPSPPTEQPD